MRGLVVANTAGGSFLSNRIALADPSSINLHDRRSAIYMMTQKKLDAEKLIA